MQVAMFLLSLGIYDPRHHGLQGASRVQRNIRNIHVIPWAKLPFGLKLLRELWWNIILWLFRDYEKRSFFGGDSWNFDIPRKTNECPVKMIKKRSFKKDRLVFQPLFCQGTLVNFSWESSPWFVFVLNIPDGSLRLFSRWWFHMFFLNVYHYKLEMIQFDLRNIFFQMDVKKKHQLPGDSKLEVT